MAAEAGGTFFLVLFGPGAVVVDAMTGGALTHVGVALAFGLVIFILIAALGHLSGAHVNPAVTVALWSSGHFPTSDVVPYIGAQCAGAVAASMLTRLALGPVAHLGTTLPAVSSGIALGVEWLLSLVLMFIIMAVATDERVAEGTAALAVGATVGLCALVGGPLTGASMNPARSFGPALAGGGWVGHWIYWVAPLSGMVVAARTYEWLRSARRPERRQGSEILGVAGPVLRSPHDAVAKAAPEAH
jgi:aquaporin NIP